MSEQSFLEVLRQGMTMIEAGLELLDPLVYGETPEPFEQPLAPSPSLPPDAKPVDYVMIDLPKSGASQVTLVRIDTFELPPRLTELLIALSDGPLGDDGQVSFRRQEDILQQLHTERGALNNLIWRLRKKLRQRGYASQLLEIKGRELRFKTKSLSVERQAGS